MNVEYLIQLLSNKLTVMANAKIHAFNAGDLPTINSLEEEMLTTQNTINKLKLLLTIDSAATSTNTTPTEIVANGIESMLAPSVQGPSASAVINGYDLSAYATDTLYEQKIQSILTLMPAFVTVGDVDIYIQKIASGSPVTGEMVAGASKQYNVDIPLLIAIMQNDSAFGTLGVGARTYNPGNVGNTGSAERSYPSWQEGVNAVADWLSNHRTATALAAAQLAAQQQVPDPTPLPTPDPVPPPAPAPVEPVRAPEPVVPPVITPPANETAGLTNTATSTTGIGTGSATSTTSIETGTTTGSATTTPPIIDLGTASTTPPFVQATSTPDIISPTSTSTIPAIDTGVSTSTPEISGATTTPPFIDPVTEPVTPVNPDPAATSTQARRILKGKRGA